jgi:hypothetical protein
MVIVKVIFYKSVDFRAALSITTLLSPTRPVRPWHAPGAAEPEVRPPRVKGGTPMELFPGRSLRGVQLMQPALAGRGQEVSVQVWPLALQRARTHMWRGAAQHTGWQMRGRAAAPQALHEWKAVLAPARNVGASSEVVHRSFVLRWHEERANCAR